MATTPPPSRPDDDDSADSERSTVSCRVVSCRICAMLRKMSWLATASEAVIIETKQTTRRWAARSLAGGCLFGGVVTVCTAGQSRPSSDRGVPDGTRKAFELSLLTLRDIYCQCMMTNFRADKVRSGFRRSLAMVRYPILRQRGQSANHGARRRSAGKSIQDLGTLAGVEVNPTSV